MLTYKNSKKVLQDILFVLVIIKCIDEGIKPNGIIDYIISETESIQGKNSKSYFDEIELENKLRASVSEFYKRENGEDSTENKKLIQLTSTFWKETPHLDMNSIISSNDNKNKNQNQVLTNAASSLNLSVARVKKFSLKDAAELIPCYNGSNITLSEFIEGCKTAIDLLPPGYEKDLIKLIKLRLYGDALQCVGRNKFETIENLQNFFEGLFGSAKTLYHLNGDLANIKQNTNENVIRYSNRLKALAEEIIAAAKSENQYSSNFINVLEQYLIKFFIRGLKMSIKFKMKNPETMDAAIKGAVEIERDFNLYEKIEGCENTVINEFKEISPASVKIIKEKDEITCQICKKNGHFALNCFKYVGNYNSCNNCGYIERRFENRYNKRPRVREKFYRNRNQYSAPSEELCCRDNNFAPFIQKEVDVSNKDVQLRECFYCKKPGHVIRECRKRLWHNNYIAQKNEEKLEKFHMAQVEINSDLTKNN